jgi:hypothetical protein
MTFSRLKSNMFMLINLNFIQVLLLIMKIMRLTFKKNNKIMTQIYSIHHHLHHQVI